MKRKAPQPESSGGGGVPSPAGPAGRPSRRLAGPARRALNAIARFAGGARPFADAAGIVAERGSGPYLFDDSGARYLDAVAGFGVASLGHSHPHWVQAVVEQAGRLAIAPLDTGELGEYLSALAGVLPPGLEQIVLYSGGAEAVETAVRIAQIHSGRAGVLTFRDGFHGKTAALRYTRDPSSEEAKRLAPRWLRSAAFAACEGHDAVDYGACEESAAASLAELAMRADLDEVGAVLVEPIQGTAGNVVPMRGFLPGLRRLCDARGWLLVLDESITGFGRTGRLFGCEYFDVRPDVMVLSKGLGGGFPLSAVCAGEELWRGVGLGQSAGTTTAFGGNPIACAAGMATLEIVSDGKFLAGVCDVAAHAALRLRELSEASPRVSRPRGVGLMLGFDLVDPSSGSLASVKESRALMRSCRERGLLIAAHLPRVRINPPLIVSRDEIEAIFTVLYEALT